MAGRTADSRTEDSRTERLQILALVWHASHCVPHVCLYPSFDGARRIFTAAKRPSQQQVGLSLCRICMPLQKKLQGERRGPRAAKYMLAKILHSLIAAQITTVYNHASPVCIVYSGQAFIICLPHVQVILQNLLLNLHSCA